MHGWRILFDSFDCRRIRELEDSPKSHAGFCVLPEKFDIPQNVIIDLLIRPNGVKAKAKFVRYDNEDDILKASFSFTGLPENAVDTISQLCIQKQLEYRRNSLK